MGARDPDSPGPQAPRRKREVRRDASCEVRGGDLVRRGVVALCPDEIRFHTGRTGRAGKDFYIHIRFDDITAMVADGPLGTLTVTARDQEAVTFHLGRLAVKWKQIIDDRPDLLRDLGVNARSRVALVAVDDDALVQALEARVPSFADGDGLDVLFVGAEHPADLARLGRLASRVRPGGVVWLVYAARGRAVTATAIVEAAVAAGLVSGTTVELSPGRLALRLLRLAR
jgi:hypothetical protein